ncbi:MAG: hypothetical protein RSF02_02790 [Bacilli bacterium]
MDKLYQANELYLQKMKLKYPQLENLNCSNNNLSFLGSEISLNDLFLGTIPDEICQMSAEDLFIYIKYKFYIHNKNEYEALINQIFILLDDDLIMEDDALMLSNFAIDFWYRSKLFLGEKALFDNIDFINELMSRRKVIDKSYELNTVATNIIISTYNECLTNDTNEKNNNVNSKGYGLSLVRVKDGMPVYHFDDDEQKLDVAGFTSILLIVIATIAFGLILASVLM